MIGVVAEQRQAGLCISPLLICGAFPAPLDGCGQSNSCNWEVVAEQHQAGLCI